MGNEVSGIYIKEAQCKPANSPTNIPAYQRVTSATDYDTVGFPVRALFDGVDDCLVVPSLDLSMTDKVTVVAGVTKLSDAATGILLELGDTLPIGSFYITAPHSTNNIAISSRGTLQSYALSSSTFSSPIPVVISGVCSISTDAITLRANGVTKQTAATDLGTGNYSVLPLNIGARNGGAGYPFTGAIQSIALIGNLLSEGEVKLLEDVTNASMGKVY